MAVEKQAKVIIERLNNKIPLFYASNFFFPTAYALKVYTEEDAKILCYSGRITELFHNEIEALPDKKFFPILIIDKEETKNFENQINFFKKYIKNFYEIDFKNFSREERMFLILNLINYFSCSLALKRGVEPFKTLISDKIKKL